MAARTVAALAAQMAAGSGDSRIEFLGDAGELHERDLAAALPRGYSAADASNTSRVSLTSPNAPEKLRKTVSSVSRKEHMIKFKAAVLDALGLLQSMCDDGSNRMQALHRRIQESHNECIAELETFDSNFVWLDLVGNDIPRVMREAKLALDTAWLLNYGMPIRTPEEHLVAEKFESITTTLLLGKDADTMLLELRRDITKLLFPLGDGSMPEIMLALNNFTLTDIIGKTTSALQETRDQLAELNQWIAEGEEKLRSAIQDENMVEAEALEANLLTWTEKRLELCVRRIGILNSSDDSQKQGALAQLEQIIKNPIVGQLLDEKKSLREVVEADIRRLEEFRVDSLRENDNAIARYNLAVEKSKRRLRDNHELQHQKWCEVEALLKHIATLDGEAERLTRDHILMTEMEQKRRQDHREFRDSYAKHRQTLDDLMANSDAAIAFTEELKAALHEGKEKLIAARIEETLKELLKKERKGYLEAFEAYGYKNQTGATRCERRLATFDRTLNDLVFIRKQCVETGDDGSTAYAKRMNDIERNIRKCRKTSEKLDDDFAQHEAVYVRLETAMLDALGDLVAPAGNQGDEPVSLHLRIKRQKVEQFKKFVEQAAVITTSNVSTVEMSKQQVAQISADASTLKASTEQKKALNKSLGRTLTTLTGVASPSMGRTPSNFDLTPQVRSLNSTLGSRPASEQRGRQAAENDVSVTASELNLSAIDVAA